MTAIVFLLTLILLPVMTIFSGKESFSSVENRTLQKKPSLSAESWFDKSFMKDFEAYVSDHFTGRIRWIDAKINTELLTGKKEINGIMYEYASLCNCKNAQGKDYNGSKISDKEHRSKYYIEKAEKVFCGKQF